MRIGRKLMLLAVMAIAAMAAVAPNAFGQSVEVTDEATAGAHCPTLAAGGCTAHGSSTGNVVLTAHIFGIESTVTTCTNEFDLVTDEDGNGRLQNQVLAGPNCTRQPCQVSGATQPWPGVASEPANGQLRLTVNFCVEPIGGGTDTTCELEVPFRSTGDHDYEFGNVGGTEIPCHGTAGFRGEVTGHWISEIDSTLEVAHL